VLIWIFYALKTNIEILNANLSIKIIMFEKGSKSICTLKSLQLDPRRRSGEGRGGHTDKSQIVILNAMKATLSCVFFWYDLKRHQYQKLGANFIGQWTGKTE